MPLLAGLGGNIGTQSITLMVRGLSTGQVTLSSAMYHIMREMLIGLCIGLFFGAMTTLVTWGWQHNVELGIVVGIAMTINMTMATIIGTFTPFALKTVNIDPAVASGLHGPEDTMHPPGSRFHGDTSADCFADNRDGIRFD